MLKTRYQRAKISTITSLFYQMVSVICGLIVPRLIISKFGSEQYGATASITQFLSYIALIEGGVGGVARAALYVPLAKNDNLQISSIYSAIKKYFRYIGLVFILYTCVLGVIYHDIANISLWDRTYTFLLVMAISIATIGQYFLGISNLILINAAQKYYVNNIMSIVVTLLNAITVVILINSRCDIFMIKLISSCVYILKPLVLYAYVKKNFSISRHRKANMDMLEQRWTGIGQHIAFFIHTNTDMVLLTLLSGLKFVSIYSIYNMVSSNIQRITRSFSAGMEAVFGDMIAKKEQEKLYKAFTYYDNLMSTIAIILFGTATIMVIPFVKIYTYSFKDVNYIYPVFAILLLSAEMLECLSITYYNLAIAANHFRNTKYGAYGEAFINVGISLCLIKIFPLEGIAIGTVIAILFKLVYYSIYSSANILMVDTKIIIKRLIINVMILGIIVVIGIHIVKMIEIRSFFSWIIVAALIFVFVCVFSIFLKIVLFQEEYKIFLKGMLKKAEAF